MKTNKILFSVLAAAGILFTACSNDESVQLPQNAQAISFRTQGGTPTGIQRTPATTIDNIDAFVVYGTDNVFGNTSLIFNKTTVARDVTSGIGTKTFTYAPTRYYDFNAATSAFVAYSPVTAGIVNENTATFLTSASFDYTVPQPNNSGDVTQIDLLVANTGTLSIPASTHSVQLDFKHALARVFVTAENSTKDPVFINALTLENLEATGTLTFDTPTADAFSWTPTGDVKPYSYILADGGVLVAPTASPILVTSMEQGMMILPQVTSNINDDNTFDATDFALKVEYTFANLGAQTKYILVKNGFEFEAGKQYRINIVFTGTDINFTITVVDFEDENITYPTNP